MRVTAEQAANIQAGADVVFVAGLIDPKVEDSSNAFTRYMASCGYHPRFVSSMNNGVVIIFRKYEPELIKVKNKENDWFRTEGGRKPYDVNATHV